MVTAQRVTIAEIERNPPEGRWEIIDGVFIPLEYFSYRIGLVNARIATRIGKHAIDTDAGDVLGANAGFVIFPDEGTLLAPAASFIAKHRLPKAEEWDSFPRLAPDLVVEVMSPSDRMTDALRKIALYQRAGVPMLWLVEPAPRTITLFLPDEPPRRLAGDETISAEPVLPGFAMTVDDLIGPAPEA